MFFECGYGSIDLMFIFLKWRNSIYWRLLIYLCFKYVIGLLMCEGEYYLRWFVVKDEILVIIWLCEEWMWKIFFWIVCINEV